MPKRTRKYIDPVSSLRFQSFKELPQNLERNAIAMLKREVEKQERKEAERERELDHLMTKLQAPVLGLFSQDKRVLQVKNDLIAYNRKWKHYRPAIPKQIKEKSRVSSGSIKLTVAPPYDLGSIYEKRSGPVDVNSTHKMGTGYLESNVWCDADDESSGISRPALGIAFSTLLKGVLTFAPNTNMEGYWLTSSMFATAQSRGASSLYVFRFKLDGSPDPSDPIASDQLELWYDKSWWPMGAGSHFPKWHNGIPMSVSFNVDTDHYYVLWVSLRTNARAGGTGFAHASNAHAVISGYVSSISLTLKLGN